jgi:hypothetical protein
MRRLYLIASHRRRGPVSKPNMPEPYEAPQAEVIDTSADPIATGALVVGTDA